MIATIAWVALASTTLEAAPKEKPAPTDLNCTACVSQGELDFDAATQAELDAHGIDAGAQRAAIQSQVTTLQADVAAHDVDSSAQHAALQAQITTLQAEVAALQQVDPQAQIAALQAQVDANTSAIAVNLVRITDIQNQVGFLGTLVVSDGVPWGSVPIYRNSAELPTDGLTLMAFFEPFGGIYAREGGHVAERWLMVYDGVTRGQNISYFTDADGTVHAFPDGWYPAASGHVEGIRFVAALGAMYNAYNWATGGDMAVNTDYTIGQHLGEITNLLAGCMMRDDPYFCW